MDPKMRKRIILINLIMTCVIAVYHFGSAVTESVSGYGGHLDMLIDTYIDVAADLAMNWFFTVTGLLLFTGFTMETYPQKLKRRFLTVLIPYLLWQLLFGFRGLLGKETKSFFMTVFLLQKYPPDGPLWYMYAVFNLALLSPLFYFPLKNKRFGFVSVVLLIAGAFYMRVTEIPWLQAVGHYGHLPNVFSYMASYGMGLYLGLHGRDGSPSVAMSLLVTVLASAFVLNPVWDGYLKYAAEKFMPVMLLYVFPLVPGEAFYKFAGGSFLIYAVHDLMDWRVIGRIRKIALLVCPKAWFVNVFCRLATLGVVIVLAGGLWIFCSLFCPKILSLLTGRRVKPLFSPVWERKKAPDGQA